MSPGRHTVFTKGGRRSNLAHFCFCLGLSFDRRESTQVDSKSNHFFYLGHAKVADNFSLRVRSEATLRHSLSRV